MARKQCLQIIDQTHDIINGEAYLLENRTSDKHFTRQGKLPFVVIIMFILNFLSKSLTTELRFFSYNTGLVQSVTKQAISKARKKIKPEAFKHIFEKAVETFMQGSLPKYRGFRVFGFDGTELYVEPTKENIEKFGQKEKRDNCKAKVSTLVFLPTRFIVHAAIDRYDTGEREMAMGHLDYFERFKSGKDLFIGDRGYPSAEFIGHMERKGYKYLLRVRKKFNTEIDETDKEDFYADLEHAGERLKVRVIKLELPSGETEVLLTNLGRRSFKKAEFMALYFMRWPIETNYNTIKNNLEIESFSARRYDSILQDFWATMYLSNIVSLAKEESDALISESDKDKGLKNSYQTNEKELINILKWKLVLCLMNESPKKRSQLFMEIAEMATGHKSEIRPGRSFVRQIVPKKSVKRKRKSPL